MSYSVRTLARPEVAPGFELAGLRTEEARSSAEAAEQLRILSQQREIGVVLLEDQLYEGIPSELQRELGRRPLPMVVPFPGPHWAAEPESAEAYIVELLRQVVGYRVRLK
jgi:vacuolar-type H+-ATPase subunit F/Vma7